MKRPDCPITKLTVSAYTIPTDAPEADGTFAWDKTTMALVEVEAGGKTGIGYTYADPATAKLIEGSLADRVQAGEIRVEDARAAANDPGSLATYLGK